MGRSRSANYVSSFTFERSRWKLRFPCRSGCCDITVRLGDGSGPPKKAELARDAIEDRLGLFSLPSMTEDERTCWARLPKKNAHGFLQTSGLLSKPLARFTDFLLQTYIWALTASYKPRVFSQTAGKLHRISPSDVYMGGSPSPRDLTPNDHDACSVFSAVRSAAV